MHRVHYPPVPLRIYHPVDHGVVINPADQWDCPPDAFLWRVDGLPGVEGGAGLLVRSMRVIEAAPALKWTIGMMWLHDVLPRFKRMGVRVRCLKENPTHESN